MIAHAEEAFLLIDDSKVQARGLNAVGRVADLAGVLARGVRPRRWPRCAPPAWTSAPSSGAGRERPRRSDHRAARRLEVLRRRARRARHVASRCAPARCGRWPARTAPASRRSCACSRASRGRTTGSVLVDGEPVDLPRPGRRARRRHRGDLPGADAVPRPLGRGERDDGPPAAAARCGGSTAGRSCTQVQELLDRLGVKLDPDQPVRGLSIADQQIVEIAKALSFDARVLIMDEPTAALSGREVERLFGVVRDAARARRGGPVHLPPPRGDLRDLRHGHRPARRRGHPRRRGRRA